MRILEVVSGKTINGALVHFDQLVRGLSARGHAVTVIARPDSWIFEKLADTHVERIPSELNRWPLSELRRIGKVVREHQIDLVHTHMSSAHTFGVLLKWITGVPCVATAHNRYLQLHWKFNDFVIANSAGTRAFHQRVNLVRPDQIETIYYGIDTHRLAEFDRDTRKAIRDELGTPRRRPVIGVVGEVIPRKGQLHLFEALPEIIQQHDVEVWIIGRFHRRESYTQRLRKLQLKHNIYRRVRWLGYRENATEHIAAMDVCVVPSIEEPLGIVPLEAMAVGVPVVASNAGGLVETVKHGRTGLTIPIGNSAELAVAVNRILSEVDLRKKLIHGGRAQVQNHFSIESMVQKIETRFEKLVKRPEAAAA